MPDEPEFDIVLTYERKHFRIARRYYKGFKSYLQFAKNSAYLEPTIKKYWNRKHFSVRVEGLVVPAPEWIAMQAVWPKNPPAWLKEKP